MFLNVIIVNFLHFRIIHSKLFGGNGGTSSTFGPKIPLHYVLQSFYERAVLCGITQDVTCNDKTIIILGGEMRIGPM